MKTIPIADATPEQVRRFTLMVGVDLTETDSPETVLAKLRKVWPNDTVSVADEDTGPGVLTTGVLREAPSDLEPGESSPFSKMAGAERMLLTSAKDDPRVVLNIQKVRVGNDVSNADVNVGVNGTIYQMKTGVSLDVPYRVWEALNNARREEITHDDQGEVVSAWVHAYPFNVEESPAKSAVAEWRAKTDHLVMV